MFARGLNPPLGRSQSPGFDSITTTPERRGDMPGPRCLPEPPLAATARASSRTTRHFALNPVIRITPEDGAVRANLSFLRTAVWLLLVVTELAFYPHAERSLPRVQLEGSELVGVPPPVVIRRPPACDRVEPLDLQILARIRS